MIQTISDAQASQILGKGQKLRALGSACLAHILHDGYTDLLYLLFPIWQREFGFSFALSGVMPAPARVSSPDCRLRFLAAAMS
jgi:hypothetical protein